MADKGDSTFRFTCPSCSTTLEIPFGVDLFQCPKCNKQYQAEPAAGDAPAPDVRAADASARAPPSVVLLDVGGTLFRTRVSVLRRVEGSLFAEWFEGDAWTQQLDGDGCFFVDRDSAVFSSVLQFLRDGKVRPVVLGTPLLLKELVAEAEYYRLPGLVELATAALGASPDLTSEVQALRAENRQLRQAVEELRVENERLKPDMREIHLLLQGVAAFCNIKIV